MEQVEAEVEQACRHGLAVDQQVRLVQVPAAWPDQQVRDLVLQAVLLLAGVQRDGAIDGIDQVRLPFDAVQPRRRVRVLEIRHEDAGARIQRVDHHLSVDGPRDLDPAIEQVWRRSSNAPVRVFSDGARLLEKIG